MKFLLTLKLYKNSYEIHIYIAFPLKIEACFVSVELLWHFFVRTKKEVTTFIENVFKIVDLINE